MPDGTTGDITPANRFAALRPVAFSVLFRFRFRRARWASVKAREAVVGHGDLARDFPVIFLLILRATDLCPARRPTAFL